MLRKNVPYRKEREDKIKEEGYPAYTTAVSFICLNILGNGILNTTCNPISVYDIRLVGRMARLFRRKNCES